MKPEQWELIRRAAKGSIPGRPPLAVVVDSPWIPGFLGISHLDYYFDPSTWFEANLKVTREFPDVIFFPSWWVEFGMAIEPSAFGARIRFNRHKTPDIEGNLFRLEETGRMKMPDPRRDGLCALALRTYEKTRDEIVSNGYVIPFATARGPLCLASYLRGLQEFTMDIVDDPEGTKKLLGMTTEFVIGWLEAQADVIGETVQGIFILDDIVGFLGREQYLEFAHPFLKAICDAFPRDWVKAYHNDANIKPFAGDLAETGFDIIQWGKSPDIEWMFQAWGDKVCPMGNIDPLDVCTRSTPEEVKKEALGILEKARGRRFIFSLGGGASPGMPGENLTALVRALHSLP